MSKAILVQVTIYDNETHRVEEQLYDGSFAWEIDSMFKQLGELVVKRIDPRYYE